MPQEDYSRTARATALTLIGLTAAGQLGGAIVTQTADYLVIQGAPFWPGVRVLINFSLDILYAALDPRVRY